MPETGEGALPLPTDEPRIHRVERLDTRTQKALAELRDLAEAEQDPVAKAQQNFDFINHILEVPAIKQAVDAKGKPIRITGNFMSANLYSGAARAEGNRDYHNINGLFVGPDGIFFLNNSRGGKLPVQRDHIEADSKEGSDYDRLHNGEWVVNLSKMTKTDIVRKFEKGLRS